MHIHVSWVPNILVPFLPFQTVTDDLGKALGPAIVAGFITSLGRRGAFNVAVCGWIPCGILLLGLVFFMRKDEVLALCRITVAGACWTLKQQLFI